HSHPWNLGHRIAHCERVCRKDHPPTSKLPKPIIIQLIRREAGCRAENSPSPLDKIHTPATHQTTERKSASTMQPRRANSKATKPMYAAKGPRAQSSPILLLPDKPPPCPTQDRNSQG